MPLWELAIPEVLAALADRRGRRLFESGQAAGLLMKAATAAASRVELPGPIRIDRPKGFKKTFRTMNGPLEVSYPVDYGYVDGLINPDDGEPLDVFVGADDPLAATAGRRYGRYMKGKVVDGSWSPDERKWYAGLSPAEYDAMMAFWGQQDPGLIRDHAELSPADFAAELSEIGGRPKAAESPTPSASLVGRLVVSDSGWGMLRVPNAIVLGLFDALHEPGAELPLHDGKLKAHVTVFTKDELAAIGGPDKLTEKGHAFRWQIGPIMSVRPAGWAEYGKVWMASVKSRELESLRKSYGLPALPRGDQPFHLTIGRRRVNVLKANDVSKAAAGAHAADRLVGLLAGPSPAEGGDDDRPAAGEPPGSRARATAADMLAALVSHVQGAEDAEGTAV